MRYVFVSGWRREPGQGGITQYTMDPESGELQKVRTFFEETSFNVTYLDKKNDVLYALNEVADLPELRFGGGGRVYIFHLDRETGECKKSDVLPMFCACPTNLSLSSDGKYVLAAGHGTRGYVTKLVQNAFGEYNPVVLMDDTPVVLYAKNPDGTVGKILDVDKHTGSGPSPKQTTARPHTVTPSPSGKLYAVCDKGNDHVYMYRIDEEANKLVLCSEPVAVAPGTEPRYCVYHPTLPFFYHNCENTTQMHAYHYNEEGKLSPIGQVEALEDRSLLSQCRVVEQQGLCMHPSGLYLYDVIYGPNQVAVFRVDQNDGSLTLIQNEAVGADWPRGLSISPDGKFLIVTCVRGKKVIVYRIGEDGLLTPTGVSCDQDNAAYATFWDA